MAEIIYDDGRRKIIPRTDTPSVFPVTPAPIDAQDVLRRGVLTLDEILGRAKQGTQTLLEAGGAVPPWAAGLVNPVPGSVPEAAIGALTAGVGLAPVKGGAAAQVIKRTGVGAGGGAIIGGAGALATDRDPWSGAKQGAISGGAGGFLAGLGNAWDALKTSDTRRAEDALRFFRREPTLSPGVRAALPNKARGLFERAAGRGVSDAASDALERNLAAVEATAGNPPPFRLTTVGKPALSPSAPDKLDRLQGVTWIQPNPLLSHRVPQVDVRSGQRLVAALREVGEAELARKAELEIIRHLEALSPGAGALYQKGITQYANDQKLVGALSAMRELTQSPGGALPAEQPGIAKGLRVAGVDKNPSPSSVQALRDALMAAHNPTSALGAGHAVGAVRDVFRRGPVDPLKVDAISRPWSLLRRGAPTYLGVRAGEAIAEP